MTQNKFWFQPFSKRLVGFLGAKPLSRAPQSAKSPNAAKRSGRGEKTSRWDVFSWGNPIKGFPRKAEPCQFLPLKNRASESKRFAVSLSLARLSFVRFCRTASCGEPLDRVPHGRTAHRAVRPPFLILWISREFRALRSATKGSAFGICQPFEKGWTENLVYARCGTYPTGRSNRRRAACRAANET